MNIKKIALGMATVGTLVPLVVVASCSSSSSSTIDYKISAKTNQVLDRIDIEEENYKQLTTLEKLFDGINKDNIEFFTASMNSRDNEGEMIYKITLTANEGYTVNGESEVSSEFTINPYVLDITPKTKVDNIFIIDIEDQNFKKIETLQKLFNNIEETDLNDSIANIVLNDIDQNKKTITLTAKKGVSFNNGLETLSSNEFVLTPIDIDITTKSNPEIRFEDISDEKYKSLETLEKLFNYINADNIKFINVSISPEVSETTGEYIVTLTANEGYTINKQPNLQTDEIILIPPNILKIKIVENPEPITVEELDLLKEATQSGIVDESLLPVFSKLFIGVNKSTLGVLAGIQFGLNDNNIENEFFCTIIAKESYSINESGVSKLKSAIFKL